ncbi:MAG: AAA family ATPase, partial [Acidimicrobiales bacterium]
FETEPQPARPMKGVEEPLPFFKLVGERVATETDREGRAPLVNRVDELARLRATWRAASSGDGRPRGVLLRGEAGIGKSRLALAIADEVRAIGGVVAELVGSPLHTETGFFPVRTMLETIAGVGRDTDGAERLRRLRADVTSAGLDEETDVPLLAPVLGVPPAAG